MNAQTIETLENVIRRDGRYPPDAYEFLQEGLVRAAKLIHGSRPRGGRHVTGAQLCLALRDLALERWGPLAGLVLSRWHIRSTRDFGEMVYFFVELGLFGVQETDDISDFDDVYDFADAFGRYEFPATPRRD